MKPSDLDPLFRELRHRPRPRPGGTFTDDVMRQLGTEEAVLPSVFLALVTSALFVLSATIGWSIGRAHGHGQEGGAPPPLIGFCASECFAVSQ